SPAERGRMNLGSLKDRLSQYPRHRGLIDFGNLQRAGLISVVWFFSALLARSLSGGEDWSPSNFSRVDWQPTRAVKGENAVDARICAKCHPGEAATQSTTPMGLALETAMDSEILRSHPRLRFREGPFDYTIMRTQDQVIYTV